MLIVFPALLAGCGGGGGLAVSGGSIPTGTITGLLSLPSGQPLTSASASVHILGSVQTSPVNVTVNASGNFVATGVPIGKDIALVFRHGTTTLKSVLSSSQLQTKQPVNIGTVNALTTVVASCIELETDTNPSATGMLVASQTDDLTVEVEGESQTQGEEDLEITDPSELAKSANTAIVNVANTELAALASSSSQNAADSALDRIPFRPFTPISS